MTRNEMLSIINATIRNYWGYIDEIVNEIDEVSEDILKTQEIMGMLPPKRLRKTVITPPRGEDSCHTETTKLYSYTWEDEDDR